MPIQGICPDGPKCPSRSVLAKSSSDMDASLRLGDQRSSEVLIKELYVDLRRRVNQWAAITHQTAQARMGYVGQHLVSVVTGYPGGKSGARGHDLIIDPTKDSFGEIKTCYRIDQLGLCLDCGARVAAIEQACSVCDSDNIAKKDDSKWLLTIKDPKELREALEPTYYFLVLFEGIMEPEEGTIQSSVWRVDPNEPGFALCAIDYFLNIRSRSKSKAPFNWWPYSAKFYLMKPELAYRSLILSDDTIRTITFGDRYGQPEAPGSWAADFSRSSFLKLGQLRDAVSKLGIRDRAESKAGALALLDSCGLEASAVADAVALCHYGPDIQDALLREKPDPELEVVVRGALARFGLA
jgi:hypothetical protein